MMVRRLFQAIFGLALLAGAHAAQAQQTGVLIGGGGVTVFNTLPAAAGYLPIGQGAASNPQELALSGDCSLTAGGVITCLKTNGASFGTAATANTGTSGTAVPLLNIANTWSAMQTFSSHIAAGSSAPTLTSCGTSPAIVGDDKDGQVTMGTGSPTGCVITFATAYTAAPLCTVSWQATPLASQSYTVANTAITTIQTATSSNKLNYHCTAQNGG